MLSSLSSWLTGSHRPSSSPSGRNDEPSRRTPPIERPPTPMRQTVGEMEEAKMQSGLFFFPQASRRETPNLREDHYDSIRSRKPEREKRKRADSQVGRRENVGTKGFTSVEHLPVSVVSPAAIPNSVRHRELRHTDLKNTNRSEPRLHVTPDAQQETKPVEGAHGDGRGRSRSTKTPDNQQMRSDVGPKASAAQDEGHALRKIKSNEEQQPASKDVGLTRGRSATIGSRDLRAPEPAPTGIVNRGDSVGRGRSGSVLRRVGTPVESVQQAPGDNNGERFKRKRDPSVTRDGQIMDLKAHNESLEKQLTNAQDELLKSKAKNIELQKSIHALQDEKNRILTREATTASATLAKERDAQAKATQLEEENRRLRDSLKIVEERQLQTSRLLEVRSADLKGAQTFLTTADQYSGSDIIAMVESLNAEIFQTAAFMAELMENASIDAIVTQRQNLGKRSEDLQYSRRYIGEGLFAHLTSKPVEVQSDPLPLQLAFQAMLSFWCSNIVRAFCSGPVGDELFRLYTKIRENELQAVAGRWRAITASQITGQGQHSHADHILNCVISLLHYCGWQARAQHNRKTILSMQQMIQGIEKQCTNLKNATKEGITTADMEVFIIPSGHAFDGGIMEDIYAEPGRASPGGSRRGKTVLCAVGMGLRKSAMKRSEGGAPDNQSDVLTRVKVVLDSVIFDHGLGDNEPKGPVSPRNQDGKP